MKFPKRTHTCGALRLPDAGQVITLNGWIESRRDLGNLIFLDVRDRYGHTQVVLDPSENENLMQVGHELRPEYVISVTGKVRPRPDDARNKAKATGEIEVLADTLQILNSAKTPPFEISDTVKVSDELRMRHRYLDLRRNQMQANLKLRHDVVIALRNAMSTQGFIEVETPILTKSTPEGARDFLVPSRIQNGRFYALPQSPQLFKQLLMVGGLDRYFQIVKCMRDEDLRADRQPEFTQLDMEISFAAEEDVYAVIEEVINAAVKAADMPALDLPLHRISYAEAMERFGSDKPDMRFGMEFFDLTELALGCGFKVFKSVAESKGRVLGINAKGCSTYSRKDIDGLTKYVAEYGAKGLAWFKVGPAGTKEQMAGPIAKFFTEEELAGIAELSSAEEGDLILIIAASERLARNALGELRVEMGRRLDLLGDEQRFCWITEFPMFEEDEDTGAVIPTHHPFTTPQEEYDGHLEKDPLSLRARAYDLVLNGVELGSGSVRIHDQKLQQRVFAALGIGETEAREKFGFLLDAFEYGAPPHAGMALGLDRMVMLLAGQTNIREVIAFPKTATGSCPLTSAPTPLEQSLLEELGITVKKKGKVKEE